MERETDVSRYFFVTCADVHCVFTFLSHDDDLHPPETLSVQSYEICDSPSIRSYRMLVYGIFPILTIAVLAPIIDHNSMSGYNKVVWALLFCLLLFCVYARERS